MTWPIHLNTASLSAGKFLRSLDNDRLDPKCQQAYDQRFSLPSPPGRELTLMIKVAQLRIKRSSFLAQARTFKRFVFLAWKLYFWHLTRVIKPEKHMCEGALVRFETTGRDKDARGTVCATRVLHYQRQGQICTFTVCIRAGSCTVPMMNVEPQC